MFYSRVFPIVFVACTFFMNASPTKAGDFRTSRLLEMCSQCHGLHLEGYQAIGAPSIAGLPEWYIKAQLAKFRGGIRGKHPHDIAGMRMRPLARSLKTEEDVAAIAAAVSKIAPVKATATIQGGDANKGKEKFGVCVSCHGADLAGNEALSAPPLKVQNDWYLVTQLRNFKNKVRGGNAQLDPTGATMTAMAGTLEDEQALRDIAAYISSIR